MGHILLRLTIWFLLTNNFSWENIAIGIVIALILPRPQGRPDRLKEIFQILGKILIAIPQAYVEAFQMILRPHREEIVVAERVKAARASRLVFLDVFLITFTPKTIVLNYNEEGWYDVHRVQARVPKRIQGRQEP